MRSYNFEIWSGRRSVRRSYSVNLTPLVGPYILSASFYWSKVTYWMNIYWHSWLRKTILANTSSNLPPAAWKVAIILLNTPI
jgi:hypothetical protein